MDWESGQQLIRKMGDAVAGMLVAYGAVAADAYTVVAGAIVGVASLGWWYIWNRKRPAAEA
jgi:hypothetical protein